MIVITAEVWKNGDPNKVEKLGQLRLTNDGTGNQTIGNYNVTRISKDLRVTRRGRVEGHRRTALSIWTLVGKALLATGRKGAGDAP